MAFATATRSSTAGLHNGVDAYYSTPWDMSRRDRRRPTRGVRYRSGGWREVLQLDRCYTVHMHGLEDSVSNVLVLPEGTQRLIIRFKLPAGMQESQAQKDMRVELRRE